MASSVIHMCVAKEINKELKIKDENMLLLGAIAPDISKHVGLDRDISHFCTEPDKVNIDLFLNKYKNKLNDSFILGYYIHLYTDYLWEKYFLSEILDKDSITMLDGTKVEHNEETYKKYIYNDYTNLNIQLLDEYDLDLSLFYNEAVVPDVKIDEIPVDKLYKLIDYTGVIIENTKETKAYTFNMDNINSFIKICVDLTLSHYNSLFEIEIL